MKKYNVNVNGTSYEITVEAVDAADVKSPVTQAAAPVKADPAPQAAAPTAAGGETVSSPMPGTILSVNVSAGDSVKKGDVLMILEAMKMENEIMSPCDGKIAAVNTSKGASVETGTVLCVIG